ncbi:MAG: DUF192 domain-containing protein [Candidatus Paceibacterota bacterium]|jgi:hypothetical protein
MNKYLLIGLFLLVFLFGGFFLVSQPYVRTTNPDIESGKITTNQSQINMTDLNVRSVKIAGREVNVDLALTVDEQRRGLSGRKNLEEDEGMLFIFGSEGIYSFWMKDMNFPIDIIWINKDLKIIYVKEKALPESYPESFSPGEKALYVLEVPAGFSEKNNVETGDSVEFVY